LESEDNMTTILEENASGVGVYKSGLGAGSAADPFVQDFHAVQGGIGITVPLAVTSGSYSIGDVVGGLITLPNAVRTAGGKSLLTSISLFGVAALVYELWIMNADIATPAADNAAFALAAADGAKMCAHVPIAAADYKAAQNSFNFASVGNIFKVCQAAVGQTSLYAYLKATATTTPGTTALNLYCGFQYLD
jgi:hypothetical protein